jgi:hypothetical protein
VGAIMDVVVWLRSLGLGKYEAAFRENEIDETVLPSLTEEHLKQLGVTALRAPGVSIPLSRDKRTLFRIDPNLKKPRQARITCLPLLRNLKSQRAVRALL